MKKNKQTSEFGPMAHWQWGGGRPSLMFSKPKQYKTGMFCPSNARVSAKKRPLPKHICGCKNHNTCSKCSLLPVFLQKWAHLKKWGTQHHIFFLSSNGNRSTESLSSNYMFWIGIFGHEHLHIWEVGQQDHWIWPNLDHWKALVTIIYPTSLALEPYRALPPSALIAFLRCKGFSTIGWTGMQHLLPREGHQWQTW